MAKPKTPWLLYGVAAAAAGGAADLYARRSQAGALPVGQSVAPGTTTPSTSAATTSVGTVVTGPTGVVPYGSLSKAEWEALVRRLQGSADARSLFALQSALYGVGFYGATPDGLAGPRTNQGISMLAIALGRSAASASRATAMGWVVQYLARAPGAISSVLPTTLPRALIDQINREAGQLVAGFPVLQIYPSEQYNWRP